MVEEAAPTSGRRRAGLAGGGGTGEAGVVGGREGPPPTHSKTHITCMQTWLAVGGRPSRAQAHRAHDGNHEMSHWRLLAAFLGKFSRGS